MQNQNPSARPPLKVCYIAATTEGATWVFEQLGELRDRHGYEVSAILNGDRGSLVDLLRSAGIPMHVCEFDFTSSADLLGLPRKVIGLVRLLRREKFDRSSQRTRFIPWSSAVLLPGLPMCQSGFR